MSAWSIPFAALAQKARVDIDTVVRKSTAEVFGAVVRKSPVDTGRFRANWSVTFGAPASGTTEAVDPSGAQAAAEALKALTIPAGGVVYLTNGLPYARRLEYGWSKQAPYGMVRLSVLEFRRYVIDAVATK